MPHSHHDTRLFFLTSMDILPLAQDRYLSLIDGKATAPEFSGRGIRLADWYVRMEGTVSQEVVNETYGWLVFDNQGRLDLHAAHAIAEAALPSEAERERLQALVFGTAV